MFLNEIRAMRKLFLRALGITVSIPIILFLFLVIAEKTGGTRDWMIYLYLFTITPLVIIPVILTRRFFKDDAVDLKTNFLVVQFLLVVLEIVLFIMLKIFFNTPDFSKDFEEIKFLLYITIFAFVAVFCSVIYFSDMLERFYIKKFKTVVFIPIWSLIMLILGYIYSFLIMEISDKTITCIGISISSLLLTAVFYFIAEQMYIKAKEKE